MPDDDLDFDDEYQDEDETPEEEPRRNPLRAQNRKLQKELKEARKAISEAAQAQRDVAFLRAGIDLDDRKLAVFAKAYDGELNPEAIGAQAVEDGFLEAPAPPADAIAHAAVAQAGTDITQVRPDTGEPRFVQDPEAYRNDLGQARSQEDLMRIMEQYGSPVGSRTIGE